MSEVFAVAGFSVVSVLVVAAVAFTRRAICLPLVVGFVLRAVCMLGAFVTMGFLAPDAKHYDFVGTQIASVWHGVPGASIPAISAGKDAFPYMLGGIDFAFGHAPLLGLIVNVTAGTLLIPVIAATTKRLGGDPKAAAWITATFPPLLLWGDLLLRESITWLILAVVTWALVRLAGRISDWRAWGVLAGAFVLLLGFRGSATVIVAAAGLFALAFAQRRRWITVTACAVVAVVVVAAVSSYGVGHLDASRNALSRARTGFIPAASDPVGSIGSLLLVVPKVLFGPFPWEWLHVGLALGVDAVLWLGILWLTWRGWKRSNYRRTLAVVLLPAAALLLALVVGSGNYGTMQRLRVQSAVIIMPIAAVGVPERVTRRREESVDFTR